MCFIYGTYPLAVQLVDVYCLCYSSAVISIYLTLSLTAL